MKKTLNVSISTFLYHEVTDRPSESGFQQKTAIPYKHTLKEFKRDLNIINESHIGVSSINNIKLNVENDHLLLTFDDGGKSSMVIANMIEEYGWRGHFFITTSMIGCKGFLSISDIRLLSQRGHFIGSHSHTHPRVFYNLSYKEQLEEWRTSNDILESILNKKIYIASVPGGHMNNDTILSANHAGINYLFTSDPFLKPYAKNNVVCFGRYCPKKNTSATKIKNISIHKGYVKEMTLRKTKNFLKYIYYPLRNLLGK